MERMTAPIKAGGLPELQRLGQAVMPRRLFQVAIGLSQLQLGLLLAAMKPERKQLLPPLQARKHPACICWHIMLRMERVAHITGGH